MENIKVNLDDVNALKRTLDDSAVDFFLTEGDYVEDLRISNWKLRINILCVSIAIISHFYSYLISEIPTFSKILPSNNTILLICCVSYFFLFTGVLQYISFFIERDTILFTLPKSLGKKTVSVQVSSNMPRFYYHYSLSIRPSDQRNKNISQEITKPVGSWFSSDGVFHEEIFINDLKSLLRSFENNLKRDQ